MIPHLASIIKLVEKSYKKIVDLHVFVLNPKGYTKLDYF